MLREVGNEKLEPEDKLCRQVAVRAVCSLRAEL